MADRARRGGVRHAADVFLEALYPERCIFCGRTERLVPAAGGCCSPCLALLPHRRPPDRLLTCRARPDPGSRFPRCGGRRDVLRTSGPDILLRLKFNRDAGLHPALSSLAVRALRMERAHLAGVARRGRCSAAAPCAPAGKGFNQAGLIAGEVARTLGIADRSDAVRGSGDPQTIVRAGPDGARSQYGRCFPGRGPVCGPGTIRSSRRRRLTSGATLQAFAEAVARFSPASLAGLVIASGRPPTLRTVGMRNVSRRNPTHVTAGKDARASSDLPSGAERIPESYSVRSTHDSSAGVRS
jgi:predicted amidophosphoribosyltransferase